MSDTITIIGNIATEPERRTTPTGTTIASFRIASSQRRFDRETNAWIDGATNWYTVSVFRGLGEHSLASLHKGERVVVTGRLRLREWDNGTKKGTSAEIDADGIGHDLLWGTSTFRRTSAQSDDGANDGARDGHDEAALRDQRREEGVDAPDGDRERVLTTVGAGPVQGAAAERVPGDWGAPDGEVPF